MSKMRILVLVVCLSFFGYLVRVNAEGGSVTVHPTQVAPGTTVIVQWTNDNPSGHDWISLHPAGDSNDSLPLAYQDSNGSGGTLSFAAPQSPGDYNFRLFRNSVKIATSNNFSVVVPQSNSAPPQTPVQLSPANGSTISGGQGTQFKFCVNVSAGTAKVNFQISSTAMGNFPLGWFGVTGAGQFCTPPMGLWKDGSYTWNVAAMGADGQQSAPSPDWSFTLQTGNNAPTVVPPYMPSLTPNPNAAPPLASAQQPVSITGERYRGVNLSVLCPAVLAGDPVNVDNTADGWRCKRGEILSTLNWDQICHKVYGEDWHYVKLNDAIDGYRCEKGNSPPVIFVTQTPGQSNPNPANNSCGAVSRLHPGDIAIVSDFNPEPLHIYNTADKSSGEIFTVAIRQQVSVISGPKCADGYTWVEIGIQGRNGWAIEAYSNGSYNLIPNGQPLPGNGGGNPPSSQSDCSKTVVPQHLALGQTVYVTVEALNFKAGPSVHEDVKATLPRNSTGVVVGGPQCGDGYRWWQIQTSNGTWWTIEGDTTYWLEISNSQPSNPNPPNPPSNNNGGNNLQPSQTPQPQAEVDYGHADPNCGELGYIPNSSGNGDAYALDLPMPDQFKGECTYHVISEYIGLYQCWRGMPTAYKWADWARDPSKTQSKRDCGLSVNPASPVSSTNPANSNDIRIGDIVVWQPNCAGTYGDGHVAIVTAISGNMLTLDEDHWGDSHHTRPYDLTCMSFIHVPASLKGPSATPQNGIQNVSITATNVTVGLCIVCTPSYWVDFQLPKGKWDMTGYRLTFLGKDVPSNWIVNWDNQGGSGDTDKIVIQIAGAFNDQQTAAGDGYQLSNVANWRLFYVATK